MMKFKLRLKRTSHINRSIWGDLFIYFVFLFFCVAMSLPLIYTISNALKPLNELFIFPPRFLVQNPTTRNFSQLFELMSNFRVPFTRYVLNTVIITAAGTAGHVIFSSMAAYAFAKHNFFGSKILFNMVVIALMFNSSVTSIPNFLIIAKLGWINTYLPYIIPPIASALGLYLMKQFMEQMVPDALLEAAKIDGCTEARIFVRIVMPIVKPAWVTLIIFSVQGLWNMSATSFVYSEKLKTLNYALSQILAGGVARAGAGAAAAVLMMIVPIVIFVISQSNVLETMSTSGMKG